MECIDVKDNAFIDCFFQKSDLLPVIVQEYGTNEA